MQGFPQRGMGSFWWKNFWGRTPRPLRSGGRCPLGLIPGGNAMLILDTIPFRFSYFITISVKLKVTTKTGINIVKTSN
jgi:hypothetical protein